jgi:hypothetical protein
MNRAASGPAQQSRRHGERPFRIDHIIDEQHRLWSYHRLVNSESPYQVLRLLEAVSASFLGFSIPHLMDTLDER